MDNQLMDGLLAIDLPAREMKIVLYVAKATLNFNEGAQRIPATAWRERNLKRLLRSLLKLRGERSTDDVEKDFARLRRAYDLAWNRGT